MILVPVLTTSLIHFSLKGWESVLFELGSERVDPTFRGKTPDTFTVQGLGANVAWLFFSTDEARVRDCGVLVHCYAGVSRSATVTVAYIMKHLKMPLNEAYQFVKNKRPVISPNLNFMGHLLNYEKNWRNEKWGKPSRGIGVARGLDGAEGTCPCGRLFSAFATLDMRDGGAFCHLGWRHYSGLDFS